MSHDDSNFIAICDQEFGTGQLIFKDSLTTVSSILLSATSKNSKLNIEIKHGDSPVAPNVFGPVRVGAPLSIVLKMRGNSKEFDARVEQCWAIPGPTSALNYQTSVVKPAREIGLIRDDCSEQTSLVTNFENLGYESDDGKRGYMENEYDEPFVLTKIARLRAFKFRESNTLSIWCKVNVCYGMCYQRRECQPVTLSAGGSDQMFPIVPELSPHNPQIILPGYGQQQGSSLNSMTKRESVESFFPIESYVIERNIAVVPTGHYSSRIQKQVIRLRRHSNETLTAGPVMKFHDAEVWATCLRQDSLTVRLITEGDFKGLLTVQPWTSIGNNEACTKSIIIQSEKLMFLSLEGCQTSDDLFAVIITDNDKRFMKQVIDCHEDVIMFDQD
jgi:hypothetical protein